jgi:hypothetical protein
MQNGAACECDGCVHGTHSYGRKPPITSQKSLLKTEIFSSVELPTQSLAYAAAFFRLAISTIAAYSFLLLGSTVLHVEKRWSEGALEIRIKHNRKIKQVRCELRPKLIYLPRRP